MQLSRRDALLSLAAGVGVSTQPAAAAMPTSGSYPGPRTIAHRTLSANGIEIHIAEQGEGPLVLLLHGFPQSWYSWRYQIPVLAGAGYHVVAPDMRGYGDTTVPPERESYTILHTVGDVVGLVAALGASRAVVIGHDWGANVAWNAALLRPDLFVAIAALSVPFRVRTPVPPLRTLRRAGFDTHYWIYYQDPGVAEAEFERDPKDTLRRIYTSAAGDSGMSGDIRFLLAPGKGFLDSMPEPKRLPVWLTEADLDYMASVYMRTGFRGGLNWYRNIDRNWELSGPWANTAIRVPAFYLVGSKDSVITATAGKLAFEQIGTNVPTLREKIVIQGAGHFVQEERSQEVNESLKRFLQDIVPV